MKTSKVLILLFALMLFSGCTKEDWQELYLSDILGTWSGYCYGNLHHLTVTVNKDKTFTYRYDDEDEVSGSYKYVSVGGVITVKPTKGDKETWFATDLQDHSMTLTRGLIPYKMSRYGGYY